MTRHSTAQYATLRGGAAWQHTSGLFQQKETYTATVAMRTHLGCVGAGAGFLREAHMVATMHTVVLHGTAQHNYAKRGWWTLHYSTQSCFVLCSLIRLCHLWQIPGVLRCAVLCCVLQGVTCWSCSCSASCGSQRVSHVSSCAQLHSSSWS